MLEVLMIWWRIYGSSRLPMPDKLHVTSSQALLGVAVVLLCGAGARGAAPS